jgi:hypothetical protein
MNLEIKIPQKFKKVPRFFLVALTERPIWCLLILIILLFSYLAYLFYFSILAAPPPILEKKMEVKVEIYQQVMSRLNQREINLQQGIEKEYPNIFK